MAYLLVTLKIPEAIRAASAEVYQKYKTLFLNTIDGARSKEPLVRNEDVQVLHGSGAIDDANTCLMGGRFTADVVSEFKPLLNDDPCIRVYQAA